MIILRKGVKSLQITLNEASLELDSSPASAVAFTKARLHLRHTAFIELNQKAIVDTCYGDGDFRRYKGLRLLAIDGSKILLPDTTGVIEEFGEISYSNGKEAKVAGKHTYGLVSVLYDVLNKIAVDSNLGRGDAYEVELAIGHLKQTESGDLLVCDRNYPSYRFIAELSILRRDFVIRCSAASFGTARKMLRGEGEDSQTVKLHPPNGMLQEMRKRGLPEHLDKLDAPQITVRFVRVLLNTGEYEVLVTSLLDEATFPTAEFKELYHLRWQEEGFYGILKTRLNLENFTGKSAESVYQDFYATIYLSGLESLLTADSNEQFAQKQVAHPQQVNHAVSFNAIKNTVFDLLCSDSDVDRIIKRIQELFLKNPVCIRKNRNPPRKKKSSRHLLNYWQRIRKFCF